MYGRNCIGQKISLLNDGSAALAHKRVLSLQMASTSISDSNTPNSVSLMWTPSLSPQMPQLVRCESGRSTQGLSHLPLIKLKNFGYTPNTLYLFPYGERDECPKFLMHPSSSASSGRMLYNVPTTTNPHTVNRTTNPESWETPCVSDTLSIASKSAVKKNRYPCPLAKAFDCKRLLTTSGHAARHAKKHTGKKDALCPECNKSFTRKDNMQQHRRTHRNVRGPAKFRCQPETREEIDHAIVTQFRQPSSDKYGIFMCDNLHWPG